MANVPIYYDGKRKRVPASLNFDELEQKVRGKFKDIPDGEIEIKAQVTDGTTYDVEDDDDLEGVRNDLEALHVRSLSSGIAQEVVEVTVAGENYRIDQIPSPDSAIVQAKIDEFKSDVEPVDDVSLDTRLGNLCDIVDLFQLAAKAANDPRGRHYDLEDKAFQIITFLTELCHEADLFYTKSKTTCGYVLDTVMTAAGFIFDGFDDIAIKELVRLADTSSEMKLQCLKLGGRVQECSERVSTMQKEVLSERKDQKKKEGEKTDLKQKIKITEGDISDKSSALHVAEKGANQRQEEFAKTNDTLHGVTAGAATAAAAVTGAISSSIMEAGLAAITAPVVGIPLALMTATGTLLGFCFKQSSKMTAQQAADEAELAKKRREVSEAKKRLLELTHSLTELKAMDIDHVMQCLTHVKGQLESLSSTLLIWTSFWNQMADFFFSQRQQRTEEKFVELEKEDDRLRGLLHGQGFKRDLINYLARWVAFQEYCKGAQARIKANLGPLHALMERNLTSEEARRMLPPRAANVSDRLSIETGGIE